jgi:AmiR/NasT family two-component response regulator
MQAQGTLGCRNATVDVDTLRIFERAKGWIMARRGFTEDQARRYLLRLSMNTRQTKRAVAESILAQH